MSSAVIQSKFGRSIRSAASAPTHANKHNKRKRMPLFRYGRTDWQGGGFFLARWGEGREDSGGVTDSVNDFIYVFVDNIWGVVGDGAFFGAGGFSEGGSTTVGKILLRLSWREKGQGGDSGGLSGWLGAGQGAAPLGDYSQAVAR